LNRAVIRDGRPYPPADIEQFELLPGVTSACRALVQAGFVLVVVTNQPDIARGALAPGTVEHLHRQLADVLPIAGAYVCPHDDDDGCSCRKPSPGLLLRAAGDLGIDLAQSVMVGDRWRDVEAGKRAGCRTVFIDAGYSERPPVGQDLSVSSLAEAADWIISKSEDSTPKRRVRFPRRDESDTGR